MGVEDDPPKTIKVTLQFCALENAPTDNLPKDLRIAPVQEDCRLLTAVRNLSKEMLVDVVPDENDGMTFCSAILELALQLP